MFKVAYTVELKDEDVQNLLCSALEGGSNYWYYIKGFKGNPDKTYEHKHIEIPFDEDPQYGLTIVDKEGDEPGEWFLNRPAIEKGLQLMAEKYPKHFQDFINQCDDATTSDIFLQMCLFNGELIFS